ncbi:unnamed protein product [Heterobilharzia americana]|nr:unnamed protein product [Heterobilharzia americana]
MKESNILFSDILAHRLQEYLVNSRSENGWITKDFILFEPEYNNTNSCSVFKRQEVTVKAKHNEKTDQINIPNYLSHNPSVMSTCTMVGSVATGSATTTDVTTDQSNTGDYLKPINDTSTTVNNLSTESYSSSFHLSSNTVVNKANTKSITDSIVERFLLYVNEHNSIPPSVLKKFESVIDIKSFDNWQNIIHDKVTLHHLIHLLLQSGIDNWSSFLMHSSTPPPAPTTLPPVSVEDELLDYIVTSESLDSSEEGEDDDDDSEDDRYGEDEESGLTNSSNSPPRTLVNSPSSTREIKNLIYYNDNDDDNDDHADSSDQEDIDYDDWENCIDHLADLKTGDNSNIKAPGRSLIRTRRKTKGGDNVKSTSSATNMKANYIELNSNFNLLEFSIDQLPSSPSCSEHKISLRSLQIIMKIITDQVEFRKAFIHFLPVLSQKSYAGPYFIKCVDRIIQDDYVPTLQDLLIMKQSSKAVRESLISIGSMNLRTINLGEQSEHLNKRFHYFESVNMIIFFISLEDVYRFTIVQQNKISAHQTFKLFEDIVNSSDLTRKDIIVFLNKIDILKSIISQTNNTPNHDTDMDSVNKDGENSPDWNLFIEEIKSHLMELRNNAKIKGSRLYFHVTCALDIDEMKWIMKDCIRIIFELNRRRHMIF